MLKPPKTIFAKGLILISLPLLVELAFGITMFTLQRYYDNKLNAERTAMEIIFNSNEMFITCTEVLLMKGYYVLYGGNKPPVEEKLARIDDIYKHLQKAVGDNAAQVANLARIHEKTYAALEMTDQLRPLMGSQGGAQKKAVLMANVETFMDTYELVNNMAKEIRKFGTPEFFHSPAAAKEVEKATTLVDRVVYASLAGSVLVAVLLFVYFIRSINRSVKVMVENTGRFRHGEELIPAVGGEDELATVDAAFHGMVEEIKEAQRTKQAVLAMISHDLRSPLTSVLGYFSMLTSGVFGDPPPAAISAAEIREKEIEQLIRQISDLLDLEKIEAGKLSIRPKALSAKKMIDLSIHQVFMVADEYGVTIKSPDSNLEIYADPDRIVQALANLMSNAVKISPDGSSVDTIVAKHDGSVEIRVTSPGATVSGDQLNDMFDRYHQTEGGLRLELPLSKEIIKLHGGTIGASAEPEQGCTFWMRLPAAEPGINS